VADSKLLSLDFTNFMFVLELDAPDVDIFGVEWPDERGVS